MKINTISTYVLVYLLTNGHWNLMVPVKADGGSTGGSDAGSTAGSKAGSTAGSDAGSTAGSDVAEVSTLGTDGTVASPANEADGSSSSAGADAGSSLPSGSSGESADGGSSGEAASTEDPNASTDASLASVPADGTSSGEDGSSGHAAQTVLLNGLYPDHHTSGWHADMVGPDPKVIAKRIEALSLAAEARKAADELLKAAEKLNKEAEVLTKAVEDSVSSVANEDKIEELNAKIADTTAKVQVEMKQADKIAQDNDMTYYSGFPNGWHAEHNPVLEKDALLSKTLMYRDSFPNPWHDMNWPMLDETQKNRELKYKHDKEGIKEKINKKEEQIANKDSQIDSKNTEMVIKKEAVEDKFEELTVKKQEVHDMRELIKDLQKDLRKLEQEASTLSTEHSNLNKEFIRLDVDNRKLVEERSKLHSEFLNLLEEDRLIVKGYYDTTGSIGHLHDKHGKGRYGLYSETDRPVDPSQNFSPYSVDVQGLKHYDPELPGEARQVFIGDLYPDMGGSMMVVRPLPKFGNQASNAQPAETYNLAADGATETHTASTVSTATPASETSSAEGQAKVEEDNEAAKAGDGSVAAPAVPRAGSTEAKPVEESAEAKAPEEGAKVEEAAPVSTAAPAHTAGHAAVPGAKTEAQAAPAHTAGHAAVPEAKAEAQAAPTAVKFYKTGSDGSMVEMQENTDFEKKKVVGDDKYEFKQPVVCEKVMFGDKEVWKKGDQNVSAANSVTYRVSLKAIVVRDRDKSVSYKMNTSNNEWVYDTTITRTASRTAQSSQSSTSMTRTGLASPGLARAAGGSTTNLASSRDKLGGSVTNLDTASTTGSDEGKSTGSLDVANLSEVAEADTHVSGSSGLAGATTLRGTGTAAGKTAH